MTGTAGRFDGGGHARAETAGPQSPKAHAPLGGAESAGLFEALFGERRHILLCVSGGADSTALLVLAAEWADKRARPKLSVATVDHGLRAEASEEIAAVARIAAGFELSHARLEAPLSGATTGIEAAARTLRYAALVDHARSVRADAIATAHTLDDQAETVLMRLAAGSGPAGLAAMRPEISRDGVAHLRPFLGVPKDRLVETLQARVTRFSDDAMNADPAFARARLRAGRAALEREGLTSARLATLAFRMARVNAALDAGVDEAEAAHVSAKGKTRTIAAAAAALPDEIKLRLLGRIAHKVGGGRVHLERLERLADRIVSEPSGAATLAGARIAWKADGRIVAQPEPPRRNRGAS